MSIKAQKKQNVVLVFSTNEDGELFYSAIPMAVWEEKLSELFSDGFGDEEYPEKFIEMYNSLTSPHKDGVPFQRKTFGVFTSIPADVLTQTRLIVNVPHWC